ncbi:hypothetical protein [Enterobacillus tribolii]|uniref:hypothetical protein n=1 Tax=Enterobacillus tribolii TaxID=1487935 RepID=UPI0011C05B10|nr:hypothetical protein [Enterobacillus tribolii]MBW7981802.1 hypothetical protein [Enterobacillus tribolii]
MLVSDIDRYIHLGRNANICVYREKLSGLDIIIQSLYIIPRGNNNYAIQVVFDPIGMIDYGEGWVWETSGISVNAAITIVEEFSGLPLIAWENISKTGKLESLTLELEREEVRRQNKEFISEFKGGEPFLPSLPQTVYWKVVPYPQ